MVGQMITGTLRVLGSSNLIFEEPIPILLFEIIQNCPSIEV